MHAEISPLLHFAEHPLQIAAKAWVVALYTCRIIQLFKYGAGGEKQRPTGKSNVPVGVVYSWANIFMPWAMESYRTKPFFYLQFGLFHLAVAAVMGLSFIIPYGPGLLESNILIWALQAFMTFGVVIGIYRIIRRFADKNIRAISSPDDYFSVIMITIWIALGIPAAYNDVANGELILLVYFFITAFLLFYVPLSKIMHYLYYPFTRYYFGKTMGYRGVYPLKRSVMPDWMKNK